MAMLERTPQLGLPLLAPGQGQKDVTHNEALLALDALAQLGVGSRQLGVAPSDPTEGGSWIVADGASGAWEGRDGQIATWTQGGWRFAAPMPGWLAWVADEGLRVERGAASWRIVPGSSAPVPSVALPNGGAVVDAELRSCVAQLLLRLQGLGLIEA
jgi:hypothetical protein